jgi:FkbM family methyltransferase
MGRFQRIQTWNLTDDADLQSTLPVPTGRTTQVAFARSGFKSAVIQKIAKIANVNQFVDVGANLGQTMLEVFSSNNNIEYFGFEPNPQAFSCLQELAATIKVNANLFPWACSTDSSPASFYSSSIEDCSATLLPEIRPDTYLKSKPTHIASYPLDISLKSSQLSSCFIMKVDVEGFENEVLSGAKNLIAAKRPFIFCEVLHAHRDSEIGLNNARKALLDSFLVGVNYSIFQIHLSASDRNTFQGLNKIKTLPKNLLWKSAPHTCDFMFVPRELEEGLLASI